MIDFLEVENSGWRERAGHSEMMRSTYKLWVTQHLTASVSASVRSKYDIPTLLWGVTELRHISLYSAPQPSVTSVTCSRPGKKHLPAPSWSAQAIKSVTFFVSLSSNKFPTCRWAADVDENTNWPLYFSLAVVQNPCFLSSTPHNFTACLSCVLPLSIATSTCGIAVTCQDPCLSLHKNQMDHMFSYELSVCSVEAR